MSLHNALAPFRCAAITSYPAVGVPHASSLRLLSEHSAYDRNWRDFFNSLLGLLQATAVRRGGHCALKDFLRSIGGGRHQSGLLNGPKPRPNTTETPILATIARLEAHGDSGWFEVGGWAGKGMYGESSFC